MRLLLSEATTRYLIFLTKNTEGAKHSLAPPYVHQWKSLLLAVGLTSYYRSTLYTLLSRTDLNIDST